MTKQIAAKESRGCCHCLPGGWSANFRAAAILALAAATAMMAVLLTPGRASAEQVHCYDAARQALSYVGRETCRYEIVSPERAAEIRKARRDYIRRSLKQADPLPDPSEQRSYGSGFFVDAAGHVITNYHVTDRCQTLAVLTYDGETLPATPVAVSPREDLALLKTSGPVPAVVPISTYDLSPGDPVTIVGFPVLKLPRREPLTMRGAYLGQRTGSYRGGVMEIDAQVWQGSSGSPAFDRYGQVVGVVFAKANIPAIYHKSGVVADDRTFAIPARTLVRFLAQNQLAVSNARPDGRTVHTAEALVRIDCLR